MKEDRQRRQDRLRKAESMLQLSLSLPLSNDSQWKEKAYSVSSVELHISFLLERQRRKHPELDARAQANTYRVRPSPVDSTLALKLGQALKCPTLKCIEI